MIELRALLPEEIAPYFDGLWSDYRKELIAAGYSEGYAEENVQQSKKAVLPDGILNPGNHIFYAYSGKDKVGKIWLTTATREGKVDWSIYDVETFFDFRGKGFGREIMVAAEDFVRMSGGDAISLSVFGNNTAARNLYESLNYETIRVGMKKQL
jgi:ribosomal protein S18 acetylase RimI-like enzyme